MSTLPRSLAAFAVAIACLIPMMSPSHALKRAGVGGMCGGIVGFQCRGRLFCDFEPTALCGAADATGTCQRRPQICTKEYRPVCGCDGKTYGNDCTRRGAGVGKIKDGACNGGE